jgi:hypothetical protein
VPDRTLRDRSPRDFTGQVYRKMAIAAAEKREREERMKELSRLDYLYEEDRQEVIDYVS